MPVNLLEVATSYFDNDLVGQISNMLGETQRNTQKTVEGALPSLLGGLAQKSSEPGGTSTIMHLIGELMTPDQVTSKGLTPADDLLHNLSNILAKSDPSSNLLALGARITQSIFGEKTSPVTNALAAYSGVKQSSASSILNIAGPVLLSLLGQKSAGDGAGISGLAALLKSQTSHVESAFPSGLGSLLAAIPGLGLLSRLANKPGAVSQEPIVRSQSSYPAYAEDEEASSGGNRWLPWLLLALGALALFFVLRSCNKDEKPVDNPIEAVVDSTASTIQAATDSAGATLDSAAQAFKDATAKLGTFAKRKLPSGLELNIPELGIENKLIQFIEDKSKPIDKTTWFNFDRLLFDTGKSTLRPESQEQLTNIVAILKEYPSVHIKLGGYTDNTGSIARNKKLSQERADSVMGELVRQGIDQARLTAEGYGPEHPVASNDTPAGRAENRRIAIRVTQK